MTYMAQGDGTAFQHKDTKFRALVEPYHRELLHAATLKNGRVFGLAESFFFAN